MEILNSRFFIQKQWIDAYLRSPKDPCEWEEKERILWEQWRITLGLISQNGKTTPFYSLLKQVTPPTKWQLLWVNLILSHQILFDFSMRIAWECPYERTIIVSFFKKYSLRPPLATQHLFHLFRKTPFSQLGMVVRQPQQIFSCIYKEFLHILEKKPRLKFLEDHLYTARSRSIKDFKIDRTKIKSDMIFSTNYHLISPLLRPSEKRFCSTFVKNSYRDILVFRTKKVRLEALSWYFVVIMRFFRITEVDLSDLYRQENFPTPYAIFGISEPHCQRLLSQMTGKFYGITLWEGSTVLLTKL
jgi:hypothetical protein